MSLSRRSPPLFEESTRKRAAEVVAAIESRTSAEVVVAVRAASGQYRHADYLAGAGLAFVALLALLYVPQELALELFPLGVVLAFALGAVGCASVPALRRKLVSRTLQETSVRTAANAAFVELGVSRTSRRTGILVFVSHFERRVEVVADIGVDAQALGPEWRSVLDALSSAVATSAAPEPFFEALRRFEHPLSRVLPRLEDDVNELPDMPEAVA
ncbi:hypothetical protein JGU66_04995 [Myxococcaceae bacterium JPH2]|nr:hypothetical protein [Myxococcaceae bacterium JPH2]